MRSAPVLLLLSLVWSQVGLSEQNNQLIEPGVFRSTGWSHYENGEVLIEPWADWFKMTARLMRDGRLYETELTLQPASGGWYAGSGYIYVMYDDNSGCRHRYGGKVFFGDGQIFLRENTPWYIPYNPGRICTGASRYEWFNHPDPYEYVD